LLLTLIKKNQQKIFNPLHFKNNPNNIILNNYDQYKLKIVLIDVDRKEFCIVLVEKILTNFDNKNK